MRAYMSCTSELLLLRFARFLRLPFSVTYVFSIDVRSSSHPSTINYLYLK
jgi:hypothetical protein